MIRIALAMDSILAWGRVGGADRALTARGAYDAPLIGALRAGRLDLLQSGVVGGRPAAAARRRKIRIFGDVAAPALTRAFGADAGAARGARRRPKRAAALDRVAACVPLTLKGVPHLDYYEAMAYANAMGRAGSFARTTDDYRKACLSWFVGRGGAVFVPRARAAPYRGPRSFLELEFAVRSHAQKYLMRHREAREAVDAIVVRAPGGYRERAAARLEGICGAHGIDRFERPSATAADEEAWRDEEFAAMVAALEALERPAARLEGICIDLGIDRFARPSATPRARRPGATSSPP
ncbi:hypothetical protein JL720_14175 [Aureococcus anophagefferens]|nr:hypothetical protein JL720_14175 [Aureococcus anophagefferens]